MPGGHTRQSYRTRRNRGQEGAEKEVEEEECRGKAMLGLQMASTACNLKQVSPFLKRSCRAAKESHYALLTASHQMHT
jgi:hypothetical protein